jgi:RND family efflux transporter MFP subunit
MSFTIEAGDTVDLLAGVFAVGSGDAGNNPAQWKTVAPWAAGVIAFLALAGFLRRYRRRAQPLLWLVLGLALAAPERPALAHEGEDHGPAAIPADRGSPARLPDGSVFVPKPAQRLLGLRTVPAEVGEVAKSVELNGHVAPDPNASGRVQASQAGRVEAPDAGLPHLGKKVKKGEVLAWLAPVASSLERGSQQSQLADLGSQTIIAGHRAERLKQLEGSVPQKEIDAARTEYAALKQRRAAVAASLYQREALRAPVDGVVSAANASVGQVVEAQAVLFEVVDPGRLWVEALGYDAPQASGIRSARAVTGDGQSLDLQFLGVGYQLREHALPLQFRIVRRDAAPAVSIGQPVRVYAAGGETVKGIPIPQGAVVKGPSNETLVWVHAAAERFIPKPVQIRPLDGSRVTVTAGLKAGERVVVQGAPLLSQVR